MSTKSTILEKLNSSCSAAVSGEELASLCGVSRAAVWKAINSLREEGYNINGTTNGGYVLASSDVLTTEAVATAFNSTFPQFAGAKIECFKEIDSTLSQAKRWLSECGSLRTADGELTPAGKTYNNAVIVAEKQTAGRGRSGRTFVSPAKTGIYLTVIYAPKGGITDPAKITAFSAVAVCRAIKKLYGIQPSIKWINDIFYNGKKICGILTEGTTNFETGIIEAAVIGIGVNIEENAEAFGGELSKVAGGIFAREGGTGTQPEECTRITRAQLAAQIAGETIQVLGEPATSVIEEYKALSFIIGREVEVHTLIDSSQGIYKATAVDIDQNAALVVRLENGTTRTLISGEVSLKSDSFTR
jgi:BirA family biotin operon repressor/biotin-[acetyl-CoA-carboxylase] ligase